MARQVAQDFKASLKTDGTSSQYVDTGFTPVITSTFSLSCWIKPSGYKTGLNNESGIFAVTDFNGHGILAAMNRGGNSQIISIGGDADPDKNGAYKLQLGVWYHFVFVYAGTTVQTYINGVLDINTSYTIRTQPTNHLFLSSLSNAFSAYRSFLGNAVDYRLFTGYAMTQTDVTVLYTNGKNPVVPSGLWLFQEGAGTTAFDTSGNGRNGTITGATYTSDVPSKKRSRVGDNLVYNGDFEYAPPFTAATAANWIDGTSAGSSTNTLFGWYIQSTGGSSKSAQYDTSVKHSGIASLKVSMGTIADSGYVDSNNPNARKAVTAIPCSPNTSYTISGYIKTNNSSGAYLRINECTGAVAFSTGTNSTKITGTQDWTLVTLTITTGANTRYLEAICQIDAGTVQDNWFDDIVLTQTVPVGRSTAQDFKSSLGFNGSAAGVALGITGFPAIGGAVTIAGWVNKATLTGARDMFSLVGSGINTNIRWDTASTLKVTKTGGVTVVSTALPSIGQWHFIAFTYNGTTNSLYVDNGTPATSATAHDSGAVTSANIGNGGGAAYIDGKMAGWAVWTRALTAAELLAVSNGSYATSGLAGKWPLNEGAGTTALDTSGNSNNGTITGATFSADVPAQKRLLVGGNLVKNGDFEYSPPFTAATTTLNTWIDGTASGSTVTAGVLNPLGWSLNTGGSARYDTGAMRITITAGGTSEVTNVGTNTVPNIIARNLQLLPNTSYTVTWRVKTIFTGSGTQGAWLILTENTGTGSTNVTNNGTAVTTTQDWTTYSMTVTTGTNTRYGRIRLVLNGTGGAGTLAGDAYFDDIVLTPTTNTARAIA